MTPSASSNETTAESTSASQLGAATAAQGTVQANNSQLNGPVQDTDYYKNEVKAGTAATTAGYDASARNLKSSMEAAGVTGRSGVAQGNATALGAQEDSALSGVKTNAFADTEAQQLAANNQGVAIAGQDVTSADTNTQTAAQLEAARRQQGAAAVSGLTSAVTGAALGFIPKPAK